MRRAGRVNAQLMDYLRPHVKAGITTGQIDEMVNQWTRDHGHIPATLGYQNYPKSCCTSVNEVICHGIPDEYVLRDGDIINVDITTIVDGGMVITKRFDSEVSEVRRDVTQCAFDCLYLAIEALTPGCQVSKVGETIVPEAHSRGFSVVRNMWDTVWEKFHLDPSIPHFPNRQAGLIDSNLEWHR